jgi:YfiH family protein|tara:strand:- start:76371 stop:77168 length:798 start_codon:yes stop_codon:yes gene_type:complete
MVEEMNRGLLCITGSPWPGVHYFCSTRQGGVSAEPYSSLNLATHVNDNVEKVALNRARLEALLPGPPQWLEQVHGVDVAEFNGDAPTRCRPSVVCADAAVTTRAQCVLAILTADCLPVVLADDAGSVLGVAHAGWRGLAAGVLENTISAMRKHLQPRSVLRAWIGPGISQAAFEVGPEVRAAFVDADASASVYFVQRYAEYPGAGQKWLADLPGLARHRLWAAGVANIELSGHCSFRESALFYSYRRTPHTGRMATVAWLSGATD